MKDSWNQYLLKLPDTEFFNILSIYIPSTKTPFNKHNLIEKLTSVLSSEKFLKKTLELITYDDAKILSVIYYFKHMSIDNIYEFFVEDYSKIVFYNKLINLEERLLIFKEGKDKIIKINPILLDSLLEKVIHIDYIFPVKKIAHQKDSNVPWFSDTLFYSIIIFLIQNDFIFKTNGDIRKKGLEKIEKTFKDYNNVEKIINFLFLYNIFYFDDYGKNIINIENYLELKSLSSLDLFLLITLSNMDIILQSSEETTNHTEAINRFQPIVKKCLSWLSPKKSYSKETMLLFIKAAFDFSNESKIISRSILKALIDFDFIIEKKGLYYVNSYIDFSNNNNFQQSFIHENLEIIVHQWGNPKYLFYLPLFCELKEYNTFPIFTITKDSIFYFFNKGYTPKEIIDIIKKSCITETPKIIVQHLENYFKEYNSIQLLNGIALITTEEKISTIVNSEIAKKYILSNPAPNVIILDNKKTKEWREALQRIGIENIPSIKFIPKTNIKKESKINLKNIKTTLPFPDSTAIKINKKIDRIKNEPELMEKAKKLIKNEKSLENIKAKIEKKLILFEDQITINSGNQIHIEAFGIDYQKKISIIKQSLKDKSSILEISVYEKNKESTDIVLPKKLDKIENGYILKGNLLEDSSEYSIAIKKIGKIRLLRSSLFAF